jgi:hypothetical protein
MERKGRGDQISDISDQEARKDLHIGGRGAAAGAEGWGKGFTTEDTESTEERGRKEGRKKERKEERKNERKKERKKKEGANLTQRHRVRREEKPQKEGFLSPRPDAPKCGAKRRSGRSARNDGVGRGHNRNGIRV